MKRIIVFFYALTIAATVFAQTNITGNVQDSGGEPVVGAVVMLEGGNGIGCTTDEKGNYTLNIPAGGNHIIKVSCLGFKDVSEQVGNRTTINFVLEIQNLMLEETVAVGYGSMRRSDLTGSVASVRIEGDKAARSSTLDQLLDGKASGVQVLTNSSSPDAGVTVRVRGIASFSGNTDPIYVVDGIIINGSSSSVKTMSYGNVSNALEETNGLSGINPSDIASIEVLKDASATAIYGSQGANGVVLITTKQASKDIPVVDFQAGVSVSKANRKLDILSFDEYVDMLSVYADKNTTAKYYLGMIYQNPDYKLGLKVNPVDWQDYAFRTAVSQRYYMSISGKKKGLNYLFSLGYNRNEGVVILSDADNITSLINISNDINSKLKITFKSNFGYVKSNLVTGAVNGGNITQRSSLLRSTLRTKPFSSLDENEDDEDDSSSDDGILYTPKRMASGTTNTSERYRITPSLQVQYKITPWLTFRSTGGGDLIFQRRVKTRAAGISVGVGNLAGIGETQSVRWNWDNTFTAYKKFGGHSITGTLGQTMSRSNVSVQSVSGWYLPQRYAGELDINNAASSATQIDSFSETEYSLLSFFGRIIYNYKNRHTLTSTLRFDGSSKFQGANKWGIFPSLAYAWRITEEPWFHVPAISNAKLRLGWGQVGNQAISCYQTKSTYGSSTLGNHFNDSGIETVLYPNNISNPALKWETSNQMNLGLDLSMWHGRFTLTVDAYQKDTKDLLQHKNIAISTGYNTMAVNDGSIRNRGLEFSIDTTPLLVGEFEWGLSGNISINRNTITAVGESGNKSSLYLSPDSKEPVSCTYFYGSELQSSGDTNPINIFIEGQSMGLFYGYWFDGIVQEGETAPGFSAGEVRQAGMCKYRDLNGNGYIDAGDRTIIGNPLPKFNYGFSTSFAWRSLSLKIDFTGSYGFDLFNLNNYMDYGTEFQYNKRRDAYYKAWTPENKSNEFPALGTTADSKFSNRYVEDGSYFRLSNISLSYDVPLGKKSKILHGLSLSASVGNVAIWSKYSGYTPMSNSYGSNVQRLGVDLNSSPLPLSYNFDVKFRF